MVIENKNLRTKRTSDLTDSLAMLVFWVHQLIIRAVIWCYLHLFATFVRGRTWKQRRCGSSSSCFATTHLARLSSIFCATQVVGHDTSTTVVIPMPSWATVFSHQLQLPETWAPRLGRWPPGVSGDHVLVTPWASVRQPTSRQQVFMALSCSANGVPQHQVLWQGQPESMHQPLLTQHWQMAPVKVCGTCLIISSCYHAHDLQRGAEGWESADGKRTWCSSQSSKHELCIGLRWVSCSLMLTMTIHHHCLSSSGAITIMNH